MVISKVVPGSVFSFEYGTENGIDSRPSNQKQWAEVNDTIAYMDYTDGKMRGGFCQKTGFSVCGRRRQLVYSFLLLSVFLRSPRPPELISVFTSSCSNSLLLTDCQPWLADKNVNFQITCSSDRSESPSEIQHFPFQGFLYQSQLKSMNCEFNLPFSYTWIQNIIELLLEFAY